MDWITETIAIGNYLDAQDTHLLRDHKVRSIVGLTNALEGKQASDLGVARIAIVPLDDGPGNDPRLFSQAVEILTAFAAESSPVLVHCHAGRSRAVVIVAAYLMRT